MYKRIIDHRGKIRLTRRSGAAHHDEGRGSTVIMDASAFGTSRSPTACTSRSSRGDPGRRDQGQRPHARARQDHHGALFDRFEVVWNDDRPNMAQTVDLLATEAAAEAADMQRRIAHVDALAEEGQDQAIACWLAYDLLKQSIEAAMREKNYRELSVKRGTSSRSGIGHILQSLPAFQGLSATGWVLCSAFAER